MQVSGSIPETFFSHTPSVDFRKNPKGDKIINNLACFIVRCMRGRSVSAVHQKFLPTVRKRGFVSK